MPHPAVQILLWASLALMIQRVQPAALLPLSAILVGVALKLSATQLRALLRRTRWILLSLLLIYAYATPGMPIAPPLGDFSPTLEGLDDGLVQLGRLLGVLSALAILLELLPQGQLIGGLYALAYPLRWVGLSRERVAVRLALTLRYAEPAMRDTARDWRATIGGVLHPPGTGAAHIELQLLRFRWLDALLVLVAVGGLAGMWV